MNGVNVWLFLVPVAGLLTLFLLWWFYGLGKAIQAERARESFRLQHERLEKTFFEKASASGTPRGLNWVSCAFSNDVEFARDRKTRRIVALVPVTVQFQAVEGGDMEGLPAVPLPRNGSAVLQFERGHWTTNGRVIFNLSPVEALNHFGEEFEKLGH